jgi:hypothetical protein
MNPWWTEQEAGLIGGIAGSVLGILGGVLGTLAGLFAPRGKHRLLVIGLGGFMIGTGVLLLIGGTLAAASGQPYSVYYPLLLVGFISTVVVGGVTPSIFQRYREADARRLEAEELRRS